MVLCGKDLISERVHNFEGNPFMKYTHNTQICVSDEGMKFNHCMSDEGMKFNHMLHLQKPTHPTHSMFARFGSIPIIIRIRLIHADRADRRPACAFEVQLQ